MMSHTVFLIKLEDLLTKNAKSKIPFLNFFLSSLGVFTTPSVKFTVSDILSGLLVHWPLYRSSPITTSVCSNDLGYVRK